LRAVRAPIARLAARSLVPPRLARIAVAHTASPASRRRRRGAGGRDLSLRSWQKEQWQQWQHSAFVQVRSRSPARTETPAHTESARTDANRHERPLTLAMQKVVGSSPIIRSHESPAQAGFLVLETTGLRAASPVS